MIYKHVIAIFAIVTTLSQAAPVLDEHFELEPGMSPISLPDGAVAYKRDMEGSEVAKRIIIDGPDGTKLKPTSIGPSHIEPMKRAIVKQANGTFIEPTPIGSNGIEPMKRYIIEDLGGTMIRPTSGNGKVVPM